jgi:hypothetical protein
MENHEEPLRYLRSPNPVLLLPSKTLAIQVQAEVHRIEINQPKMSQFSLLQALQSQS